MQTVINWQPIETAPKTGEFVLLAGGTWEDDFISEIQIIQVARWVSKYEQWVTCLADDGWVVFEYCNPTHWAPIEASV
jgi:hypothetical protein